jgi:hypothetical protein
LGASIHRIRRAGGPDAHCRVLQRRADDGGRRAGLLGRRGAGSCSRRAAAGHHLDGSHSADADGSVARFDWAFGDGALAPDGGPSPTHTYATPGTYTVSLTVTDDAGCSLVRVFTGTTAYCNGSPAARTTRTIVVPAAAAAQPQPQPQPQPPAVVPASPARGTLGLRVARVALTRAGDLRFTVTDTTGAGGVIAIAAAERRPGSKAKPSPYRVLRVTLAPNGSRKVTLRPPANVRAALRRALRTRSRVVRRPVIKITRVATGGKRTLKPRVVQRR